MTSRGFYTLLFGVLMLFTALSVSSAGAFLLGAAALTCWLLALLLWFAASITTGQIDWLTTGVLQRSVGYSLFGAFNPFLLHY